MPCTKSCSFVVQYTNFRLFISQTGNAQGRQGDTLNGRYRSKRTADVRAVYLVKVKKTQKGRFHEKGQIFKKKGMTAQEMVWRPETCLAKSLK